MSALPLCRVPWSRPKVLPEGISFCSITPEAQSWPEVIAGSYTLALPH